MSDNPYDPAPGDQCGQPHPDHPEQGCHRESYHSPHAIDRDGMRKVWLDAYAGAGPRTWSLPPEPGPDVTAVRDAGGDVWRRRPDGRWGSGLAGLNWTMLLSSCGPLSDASAEATP